MRKEAPVVSKILKTEARTLKQEGKILESEARILEDNIDDVEGGV